MPGQKRSALQSLPYTVAFVLAAGLTLGSAAGVAFARSVVHSALSLLGALLGVGALYVLLSADYVAVTQLLLYVGGVLVLILFAVMLTRRIANQRDSNPTQSRLAGLALLGGVLWVLGGLVLRTPWPQGPSPLGGEGTARRLGEVLLGEYLLVFEVLSLLLLAALAGAVVVARPPEDAEAAE